jgi:hypothetical protein
LPTQLLNDLSSPWSTIRLVDSSRQGRSHSNTNPCKFSYKRKGVNCAVRSS